MNKEELVETLIRSGVSRRLQLGGPVADFQPELMPRQAPKARPVPHRPRLAAHRTEELISNLAEQMIRLTMIVEGQAVGYTVYRIVMSVYCLLSLSLSLQKNAHARQRRQMQQQEHQRHHHALTRNRSCCKNVCCKHYFL